MTVDPTLQVLVIAAIAGLFAVAAVAKIAGRDRFSGVLRNYRLVPDRLIPALSYLVPGAEILTAVVVVILPATGALVAAGVLALYGAALASVAWRGLELDDCGCSWGPAPVGGRYWPLAARNGLIAAVALVPALAPGGAAPTGFEIMNGVAAACVVACLWAGLSALAANRRAMKAAGHV